MRALALVALLAGSASARSLDDTARFLAGDDAHAQTQTYIDYAAQLASAWEKFQGPNLEHMRGWWKGRSPATVFYPFSGPDIANALALFPDADTYLMFGLEAPGTVPDLDALDEDATANGLSELAASLHDVLQVNYFFTRAMAKKLGARSFNSVTGVMMLELAKSHCEVVTARKIDFARVPGVELTFRRRGGKLQTIRYFMANVEDAALAKSAFVPFLEKQGRVTTLIKSASYLLHKPSFSKIRAVILAQSDVVVQDDSGVPLARFARDAWRLQFHGAYDAPTPEFARYAQPALKIEMQRFSSGPLPFSYGYAFKESNLMVAERL